MPSRQLAAIALVLGGVGIGITEFVTMGLLPQIAEGLGVDLPAAGHAISAYALGVVVGSPLIALGAARMPMRAVLVALMGVFAVGNALAAAAPTYETLVGARFLAGLPHGGFFGLASLVAVAMAPRGQGGRAVGTVMLGIPIAMVVGVPLGTWAGQVLGWRAAYWAVAVIGLVTALLVRAWVPHFPAEKDRSFRTELRAFGNLQFWLAMLVGAVGFGGMFAMYSYIAPTIEQVTGLDRGWVPLFLLVYGVFSLIGTSMGGRLGDWSVLRSLALMGIVSAVSLLAFWQTSRWAVPALVTLAFVALSGSSWVVVLQLRLMLVAGEAKTLGAAMNHSALNVANALGAWLGGLVIAGGYGLRAPSLVGAGLSAGGLALLALSVLLHRRPDRR
ncbi:MFS transporter [Ornithinimicrobium tianjinense]|uniref:Permease of the major facilitator superfamily protein n=1 Tax=Ornithinimicrobium tianjinense TaxID=1195761 RepID=A0A917BSU5_9MICO|nr:MFS transporter [Ornithinimicrobium tianjinense]GGF57669.1 putative permease of the major facilitator superfamily protein [Ornithinimicrobium tianjinense]